MEVNGKMVIGELTGCNSHLLNDEERLKALVKKLGKDYKLDIRNVLTKFAPYGITVVAIIGKSHISIHTFPEEKQASIDVYTCSGEPMRIFKAIKDIFKPKNCTFYEIHRNKSIKIINSDWTSGDEQPVEGYRDEYHIKEKVESFKSKFGQQILVIENESFGKMLFIDGELQVAEKGQHAYDTALIKCIPPKDRNKIKTGFVLGGGDGGIVNQTLKTLPNIEKIDLVEIDEDVIKVSKKHFPGICGTAFTDKRVNVIINDAFKYLETCNTTYDAMFVDLTDMANREMQISLDRTLDKLYTTLTDGGYLVMQGGSSYDPNSLNILKEAFMNKFRNINVKQVWIPSYGSMWNFLVSKR